MYRFIENICSEMKPGRQDLLNDLIDRAFSWFIQLLIGLLLVLYEQ